jgi:succinyl-diaminopimelate desuccinylase
VTALDPSTDIVRLTQALVDIPSESHHEQQIADAIETALRAMPYLQVERIGHTLVASTRFGLHERVVLGGHIDTVPENSNLPSHFATRGGEEVMYGLGTCDMKGGVAVMLRTAYEVREPVRDVTYVFYDCEEVDTQFNGLYRLSQSHPHLMQADFAILLEPTNAGVEAGCQGTLRAEIRTAGRRAHSARSWMGVNAVHGAAEILNRLNAYDARRVMVDGLEYREGMSAVRINGGVANNVIPDDCMVAVNYRFAPSLSKEDAEQHVIDVFDGFDVTIVESVGGALPGLEQPAAQAFISAVGAEPQPKFGWTDVARFSGMGIPAVNYGPGDPMFAHAPDEFVRLSDLRSCEAGMRTWLSRN